MLVTSGIHINHDSTWAFSGWNDFLTIPALITLNTQRLNSIHSACQLPKEVSYPEKILNYSVK